MTYIRTRKSDTWHFHSGCQHFKRLVGLPKDKAVFRATKPKSGEMCDECLALKRKAAK